MRAESARSLPAIEFQFRTVDFSPSAAASGSAASRSAVGRSQSIRAAPSARPAGPQTRWPVPPWEHHPVPQSRLTLALALYLAADPFLHRTASDPGGALGFGCGLLAGGALELLAFNPVGNVGGVHPFLFSPAYFSTSFL